MNTDKQRTDLITRDTILKLLSDDEVARVSTREAGPPLVNGDEYIDLEHLQQGVRRMHASTTVTLGEVLPRSAVQAGTWANICAVLGVVRGAP